MTTILTTTGISLYSNAKREYKTDSPTDEQMRRYLRAKPERASSEANSLLQIAQHDDHLVFLHTQTPEAQQCAALLSEYFLEEGYTQVRLVQLDFQGDAEHIETIGLRKLVDTLINEIEKAQRDRSASQNQQVVINATAGLKAQVVYSTMIGMIYHVPVKYIYEGFQRIVTFSPVALDWDISLFLNYDWFFKWLDAEPRTQKEVERYLEGFADRERIEALLTSPDKDGEVFLSPMGNALLRKFEDDTEKAAFVDWPPAADIENIEDKIASSLLHRKHHVIKDGLSACYKIAALNYVKQIVGGHFENTTYTRLKPISTDGTLLLLWADDTKAERLTIYTTAKGYPQTLKVAERIKEILEIK